MSYPSMVESSGELYCVPETLGEAEVAIYQCLKYPNHWKKVKTLLDNQMLSDPTVFFFEVKWWLFATRFSEFSGGNDQLWAWSSDELLGTWVAHKKNPIKVDVGSARSAGMPCIVDEALYRPSQDCSRAYGGGVVLNRVTKLSSEDFAEEEVSRWRPDQFYPEGCHYLGGVWRFDSY